MLPLVGDILTAKKLIVFGFGGHARSVADVALACGYSELLFVDSNAIPGESFMGYRVIREFTNLGDSWCDAFAASGDSRQRQEQCQTIARVGLRLVTLIAPSASVGVGSVIGSGCMVGHHAHIGPMAAIGQACIINTGAVVEHESRVGDYAHVSVNSTIAGRSELGAFSMLGAGATIIDKVRVADNVVVGAGAVVATSLESEGTYVGVPARKRNSLQGF